MKALRSHWSAARLAMPAVPFSLNAGAPNPLRHAWHHLARIKANLEAPVPVGAK